MKRKICLNGRNIEYELTYKNVRNLNLRVRSDMTVSVSAGKNTPINIIEDFIKEHTEFILETIKKFSKLRVNSDKKLECVTGETVMFFGNQLPLTVVEGKNKIGTNGKMILMSTSRMYEPDYKNNQLDKWLEKKCRELIEALCQKNYPPFKEVGVEYPKIVYRNMTSRWGSCNYRKKILTFSKQLVHYPVPCIEYVVVHEFAHFLQPNHSKNFYKIIEDILPDYRERKKLLSEMQYNR